MTAKKLSIPQTKSSTGWSSQEIRILTEATAMIACDHKVVLVTPSDAQCAEASLAYRRNFGIDILLDRVDKAFRQAIAETATR